MAETLVWVDGTRCHENDPVYFATDRGATLGDAVFDTCLCLNGKVVGETEHLARISASANAFHHNIDPKLLAQAYQLPQKTLQASVLRVSISRGPGARGLKLKMDQKSQITATLSPLPEGIMFAKQSLTIANIRRNETSSTSHHKTAGYLDSILAQDQAQDSGFDDAIFLNSRGEVACTTLANLFVVTGSTLITPDLGAGIISGITRQDVLRIAQKMGLAVVEGRLKPDDLTSADEVFATNSLRLIMPASNLGKRRMDITKAITKQIVAEVKRSTSFQLPDLD